ncbi:MAG: hypothetical protein M3Z25_04880 [Actinomycetota bacterium]|nr:hypothetical protein [Actinomycetota bacterium]
MGAVLGLGGPYFHDSSACVVIDGAIVAFAEEERFSRRKHHRDSRDCSAAAAYCLSEAGITLTEVDEVAIAFNPGWPRRAELTTDDQLIADMLDPRMFDHHSPRRLTVVEHHLAHAASAFHPSGFGDAAVLVVDGSGDGISTTLAHGTSDGLRILRTWPFTQSLGWFYETVAEHLGLGDWTSAGKLMGLAAYGTPHYDLPFLSPEPGGYRLDLTRCGIAPDEDVEDHYTDLGYYRRLKNAYTQVYTDLGVAPHPRARTYEPAHGLVRADSSYHRDHADLAASAQLLLEECLVSLARAALAETGCRRLCIAGGVGLNCTANGRLARLPEVAQLFVQPAAGDSGCAIGAALHVAHRRGEFALPGPAMTTAALGPSFTDAQVHALLDDTQQSYSEHGGDIAAVLAARLADGAVAGWFQGRMEAGPRALGQRSILADPRDRVTRDRINRDIKHREHWRPLAPALHTRAAPALLGTDTGYPFMTVATEATGEARRHLAAAVHVDGSLRPQTVPADLPGPYPALLDAFAAASGAPPALINTSFNHEAEPIVCTPRDALRTFHSGPLDVLAIGGFLLDKHRRP